MRVGCGTGTFGSLNKLFQRFDLRAIFVLAILLVGPAAAFAQSDEIQVYDGSIADKGKFNITLHSNFTPAGIKTAAFPGGIIPDRSYNGTAEWAWGVTDWFEQGLYMPLYSISLGRGGSLNGFKLRELFVRPHGDDHLLAYGVNFEFSYNARYWDPKRSTAEIRPIIGLHLRPVDIIFNPILDTSYDGFKNLDFAPSTRIAYNVNPKWAMALEEYSDYGPLHQFYATRDQGHQAYVVVDHDNKFLNFEFGVGFGLTAASDKVTIKLILSRDLN